MSHWSDIGQLPEKKRENSENARTTVGKKQQWMKRANRDTSQTDAAKERYFF